MLTLVAVEGIEEGRPATDARLVQEFVARGRRLSAIGDGIQSRWRQDGEELYFLSRDRRLMAVPIKTEPAFALGAPVGLFDAQVREYADRRCETEG